MAKVSGLPHRLTPGFDVEDPTTSHPRVLVELNERQRIFAKACADGKDSKLAYRMAGYEISSKNLQSESSKLFRQPKIQAAIAYYQRQSEAAGMVTRKKVMDGFLRAIEMSEMLGDPHAMIKGWSELGKMCGYYAPEVKKIDINLTAKRLISKFETMTDEDLVKMMEESVNEIEGEAVRVDE